MTKSLESDVAVKGVEPFAHQDAPEVQAYGQIIRMPVALSNRDDGAGRLDAVAGCEFVDDRIRLRE